MRVSLPTCGCGRTGLVAGTRSEKPVSTSSLGTAMRMPSPELPTAFVSQPEICPPTPEIGVNGRRGL
jgi:hypothetical protein